MIATSVQYLLMYPTILLLTEVFNTYWRILQVCNQHKYSIPTDISYKSLINKSVQYLLTYPTSL